MADWFDGAGSGGKVDVDALLDGKAWDMLRELISAGVMVTLSTSSDGGAFGVTITCDGRWRREYFRDAESLTLWMEEAMAPVLDAAARRAASGDSRSRSRRTRGL